MNEHVSRFKIFELNMSKTLVAKKLNLDGDISFLSFCHNNSTTLERSKQIGRGLFSGLHVHFQAGSGFRSLHIAEPS